MTWQGWAEIALTLALAVGLGWPLGALEVADAERCVAVGGEERRDLPRGKEAPFRPTQNYHCGLTTSSRPTRVNARHTRFADLAHRYVAGVGPNQNPQCGLRRWRPRRS